MFFFFKQKTAYEITERDWSQTCALPILSAELDSDFSDVRWNDEPAAMPTVGHAPAAAPEVKLDAPDAPPRILTLEEEMERLLGDFDFETSDRKTK